MCSKGPTLSFEAYTSKLVPPRANVLINKDPQKLILLKIWTPSEEFGQPPRDEKRPWEHISLQNWHP